MKNTQATEAGADNAKKILIVEDEGDMCLLINLLLHGKEVQVDHVRSLAAAEDHLLQEQPALILLDNRMPDGLGLDFVSFLKAKYPAIKILMMSGVDAAARDIALENGADAFLSKPFNRSQLLSIVQQLLKAPQATVLA